MRTTVRLLVDSLRPLGRAATAAFFVVAVLTAGASGAGATGERAGDAVIVAGGTGSSTMGGDGQSPFSIRLPDGAACPGDSAESQYRVQSFLAPEAVDPGSLVYKGLRPRADGAWALYETSTRTYMNAATDMASTAGGEGAIINLPSFSFAVFDPGMIAPGRYHIGIACSLWTETERYWSTMIEVTVDDDDAAGIAWTVLEVAGGASGADDTGSSAASPIFVGAIVAVAVGVGVVVRRRSSVDTEGSQVVP